MVMPRRTRIDPGLTMTDDPTRALRAVLLPGFSVLRVAGLFLAAPHAPAGDSPLTSEIVAYKAGDVARIIECAPKSKLKTWEVLPKGSAQQA